jgi:ATP-binding cassette subfamily A (ABC1) protein 3
MISSEERLITNDERENLLEESNQNMDQNLNNVEFRQPKASGANFNQLRLLIWKNWCLQKRSIIGTVIELFVPALFAIILLPIRTIVDSDQYLNDTIYPTFNFDSLPLNLQPDAGNGLFDLFFTYSWSFAYYPNNTELGQKIAKKIGQDLKMNMIGFGSEDEMVKYVINPEKFKSTLGAVIFLNESLNNFEYKIRLSYSPRFKGRWDIFRRDLDWKTKLIYWLFPILGPRDKAEVEGGDPGYYREGFLAIQKSIDMALIQEYQLPSYNDFKYDIRLQRFPYPPYADDKFVAVIQALFPFIIMLSFIFTVILTAKSIVHEKETGIKEAMRLMGMKTWVYWLSWYIKTFLMLTPSVLFMIFSYKIKLELKDGGEAAIIDKTDTFLFSLFLFLYVSSSITFTFLCTTFFKKANSAAAGAGIIWFFSYLPYIFISLRYEKMTMANKISALFVNNLAMSEGMQLIG